MSHNINNILKYGRYYTGVGARRTPRKILYIMEDVASKLSKMNFILRSGGADGADNAFEIGAGNNKNIFYASDANQEAMDIAAKYHQSWDSMSMFAKRLHGRNAFQILGKNLDNPSTFILCWSSDGCICHEERSRSTGGTGTAISIASVNNVPVYNLKRQDHLERILNWIK